MNHADIERLVLVVTGGFFFVMFVIGLFLQRKERRRRAVLSERERCAILADEAGAYSVGLAIREPGKEREG